MAETKICEISYVQRGGERKVVKVHPRDVERRRNGDVVYHMNDGEHGRTSVWVSAAYILAVNIYNVKQKVQP